MRWDEPSPTITTQCTGLGNGRFGHPSQDRAITPREAAMLQTFPMSYRFFEDEESVSLTKAARYIGNAVPPKLGEVIADSIKRHLGGVKYYTQILTIRTKDEHIQQFILPTSKESYHYRKDT